MLQPQPAQDPLEVVEGRVWRLGGDVELDGRVSWAPADVRGRRPVNSYLVRGDGSVLLVDTGVRAHQQLVLQQLRTLVEPGTPVSIVLTRTEMDCCLNIPAIEKQHPVQTVYFVGGITVPATHATVEGGVPPARTAVDLDLGAGFGVHLVAPRLRLLPTVWVHDPVSRVLFTSDTFCHTFSAESGEDPIVTGGGIADDQSAVEAQLMTRLSWMAGTDVSSIVDDLTAIFDRLDVDVLAPGHGRPLAGRGLVERQRQLVTAIVKEVGARVA
jgi:flavorubredoxin